MRRAALPIKKEVLGKPLWSDDLEDDLVRLQGLAVDPAGQGGVEALGQPFAYCQLLGNHLVFCIVLQNLRQEGKVNGYRERRFNYKDQETDYGLSKCDFPLSVCLTLHVWAHIRRREDDTTSLSLAYRCTFRYVLTGTRVSDSVTDVRFIFFFRLFLDCLGPCVIGKDTDSLDLYTRIR